MSTTKSVAYRLDELTGCVVVWTKAGGFGQVPDAIWINREDFRQIVKDFQEQELHEQVLHERHASR